MAGATLTGALAGLAIGAIGTELREISGTARLSVEVFALGLAVAGLVQEARGRVAPLPERRAQVPRRWSRWRSPLAFAGAYGAMVGAGALTFLNHAVAYVLAGALLVTPTVPVAALVGATYGFTRGLSLVISWVSTWIFRRPVTWEGLLNRGPLIRAVLVVAAAACFTALVGSSVINL